MAQFNRKTGKEQEKKNNEREKKRALKAANQTKTKKKMAMYSSGDEAEDGLEKTHREKERAEKKQRSGNKKGALKGSKPTKPKKKVLSSSSEESDLPIPLSDGTDYESSDVQSDDDDGDKDLSAGDFVIVKFTGNKSSYNYVGLVENVVGDEISARFLKKSSKRSADGKPIFTFRENDEGVIPRGDVLKKLPTPPILY